MISARRGSGEPTGRATSHCNALVGLATVLMECETLDEQEILDVTGLPLAPDWR